MIIQNVSSTITKYFNIYSKRSIWYRMCTVFDHSVPTRLCPYLRLLLFVFGFQLPITILFTVVAAIICAAALVLPVTTLLGYTTEWSTTAAIIVALIDLTILTHIWYGHKTGRVLMWILVLRAFTSDWWKNNPTLQPIKSKLNHDIFAVSFGGSDIVTRPHSIAEAFLAYTIAVVSMITITLIGAGLILLLVFPLYCILLWFAHQLSVPQFMMGCVSTILIAYVAVDLLYTHKTPTNSTDNNTIPQSPPSNIKLIWTRLHDKICPNCDFF